MTGAAEAVSDLIADLDGGDTAEAEEAQRAPDAFGAAALASSMRAVPVTKTRVDRPTPTRPRGHLHTRPAGRRLKTRAGR